MMPDPNQIPDEPRAMPPEDQIHDDLICDKCGREFPSRAGVCPYCGDAITDADVPAYDEGTGKQREGSDG